MRAGRPKRNTKRNPSRRRANLGLVATMALLLTCAIAIEPARAGTYVMRNCDVPGHANSPMDPWHLLDPIVTEVSLVDACATGGGVSFVLNDLQQMNFGRNVWIMLEKPDGPRSQIKLVKVVMWYAARLASSGHPITFQSGYYIPDHSYHAGPSNLPPGSENLVAEQQLPPDTWYFKLGVHCGPLDGSVENPVPCTAANRVPLLVRGMEVTLSEDVPPMVMRPGGSVLDGETQSGIRTLTYSALDPQSGLSKVDVLLDETVVATRDLTPRCSYSDFTVCPSSVDDTLQVDTRDVANGTHRLAVRVQDAAGNVRLLPVESPIDVANVPDPAPATLPGYSVNAHFKGTSRSTLVVPYGRRIVVRGRLTHASEPIVAGVPIEVLQKSDRKGKREKVAARVETEADGSFAAVLAMNGPSRAIRFAYRPIGGGEVVSRSLKLRVRAASRMRASLHGRLVHFSGHVLSGPIAQRGKKVLMEGRSPGSAWTQFKSLRTDRRGRFSGKYRLRVRRPGVVLKVRAVVPSEAGYGYLTSRSRATTMRVR